MVYTVETAQRSDGLFVGKGLSEQLTKSQVVITGREECPETGSGEKVIKSPHGEGPQKSGHFVLLRFFWAHRASPAPAVTQSHPPTG